jgi:hypothetical protein
MEAVSANSVVDGLALLRLSQTRNGILWGAQVSPDRVPLPARDSPEYHAITAELKALEEAVDALGDALTAESMYQLVQGNPIRAGATLDAVSRGEAPPPELHVTRTPRTGVGLTHRVLVLFSGDAGAAPAWPADERQVRARAEPHLNAWAARLLGDPAKVRCRAEYLDPGTGTVLASREDVRLSELVRSPGVALSPLDVLSLSLASDTVETSTLEQLLAYHLLRTRPAEVPPQVTVRLRFDRGEDWAPDEVGFGEFLTVAHAVAQVIADARPIDGRDLSLPENSAAVAVDADDLRRRADAAAAELARLHASLAAQLPAEPPESPAGPNLEVVRDLLLRLLYCGVDGAVPVSAAGETEAARQALLAQARTVQREVERRVARVHAIEQGFDRPQASVEQQRDHDLGRLKAVFGQAFQALPRLQPENAAELGQAFASSDALQGGEPAAVFSWFQRAARVRPGVDRLHAALTYVETLSDPSLFALTVGQLPWRAQDRWVALPPEEGAPMAGGRLSLVAHLAGAFDPAVPLAGLLVDEWTEVVPNAHEITGVAFNFDQPRAQAPQTILLAVPPEGVTTWTASVLEAIVLESLELAKLRAIDPETLYEQTEVGSFLPALYFALNLEGATVSTDFRRVGP